MTTQDPIRTPDEAPVRRGHHNKGRKFPAEPITVEYIVPLLEAIVPMKPGPLHRLSALRLRALVVVMYRTGLRISEALALEESDLNRGEESILVRRGKGGKHRIVLMDPWGWGELDAWLAERAVIRPGAIFCVLRGITAGQAMSACDVRRQLRMARDRAGLRRRSNPHGLRHGFSVEFYRETGDISALQAQLGHAHLGVTSIYLAAVDPLTRLAPVAQRKPPMMVIPPVHD
jgi:site-specific recombinase XerD